MRVILLLLMSAATITLKAQTLTGNLQIEASKIHATVKDAVFIIRQDYYIRDTKDSSRTALGLNKKPYFGRLYFFAINISGSLVTDKGIRTPWLYDPNFSMVRDSARYVPALGAISFRRLTDTVFQHHDIRMSDTLSSSIDLQDSSLVLIPVPSLSGLALDTFPEEKADTAMWFWTLKVMGQTTDRPNVFYDSIPTISYEVQKGRYSPKSGGYIAKNYYTSSSAISGLILSSHSSLGRMDFKAHGIIIRRPKGKFDFRRLRIGVSQPRTKGSATPATEAKPPEKVVITRIESKD